MCQGFSQYDFDFAFGGAVLLISIFCYAPYMLCIYVITWLSHISYISTMMFMNFFASNASCYSFILMGDMINKL